MNLHTILLVITVVLVVGYIFLMLRPYVRAVRKEVGACMGGGCACMDARTLWGDNYRDSGLACTLQYWGPAQGGRGWWGL